MARIIPLLCGGWVASAGLVSLIGWRLWRPLLSALLFDRVPMAPTTALLFVFLGGIVILKVRWPHHHGPISTLIGALAGTVGATSFLDDTIGTEFHLDQILFHDWLERRHILSEVFIPPASAVCFVLVGAGLLLANRFGGLASGAAHGLFITVILVAVTNCIGHLYHALGFYEVGELLPMALLTSINFLVLTIGLVALRPNYGFVGILTAPDLGGAVARPLFVVVALATPLLGLLCLGLTRRGALDIAGGMGLLVTLTGLVMAVAIVVSARRLEKTGLELKRRSVDLEIAREESENANRSKSTFLANMSHELRTPLNAIIGFSEIMRDARLGRLSDRYRDYSADIYASGVHLLAVVNQILDLAKVEAGQFTLVDDDVVLIELAASCLTFIRERASASGVTLDLDIPDDFPVLIVDEMRIRQVLLNLISNAVKFTRPGGSITIDARILPDGSAEIRVCDTGIGMSEHEIALAFEPFRQVESAQSRGRDGTGLGLPLAKALVERHDGELHLQSARGVGTTARIHLPVSRVAAPTARAPAHAVAI